jgi:GT2 family glycosyltransferase/glycosyltransferase involved in cell wall biosynthesis
VARVYNFLSVPSTILHPAEAPSTLPKSEIGDPADRHVRHVGIVIVNFNGAHHLPDCLDSIGRLDYPASSLDVLIVDNGSTDGSTELLRRSYPSVQLLQLETNVGFAEAVNRGAAELGSECLALLNNDMRVDRSWLRELTAEYDPDGGAPCVGGLILDWDGTHVDFAEAAMNFHGFGDQVGYRSPIDGFSVQEGRDLLFACGGSMLVNRQLFLNAGGFDPAFFAYFEDVDFGWRLRVLGHNIRLAEKAISFHRHHGTSAGTPPHQRAFVLERNALRAMIKNFGDDELGRVLGPALLLLADRAVRASGSDIREYTMGSSSKVTPEHVQRTALSPLHAVADVVADLDSIMASRHAIQLHRATPDSEIFRHFGHPFRTLGSTVEPGADEAMARVVRSFGLDRMFEQRVATRTLVLAYEPIGARMAGPAVRSWEIACSLSRSTNVVIASPERIERSHKGLETAQFKNWEQLYQLAAPCDVIIVFGHALERYPELATLPALLVVDLYDPWTFELLEQDRSQPLTDQSEQRLLEEVDVQNRLLDLGDYFLCASERQRDYWLGMLTARGRLSRATYRVDPDFGSLVEILPYGCDSRPPQPASAPVMRTPQSGIGADDFVLLWSGGSWEWFDPVTVVEALALAIQEEPGIHLYAMGLELNEDRGVPASSTAVALRTRAQELGLAGSHVHWGPWVPYDERGAYLLEADVAVVASKPVAETRLSFRSRMLDHLWAGLPTITTGGDILSETFVEQGAALRVPFQDARSLADEIVALARDQSRLQEMRIAALNLADSYRWDTNVERALRPIVDQPWRWRAARAANRARQLHLTEPMQQVILNGRFTEMGIPLRTRLAKALKSSRLVADSPIYPTLRKFRRSRVGRTLFGPLI